MFRLRSLGMAGLATVTLAVLANIALIGATGPSIRSNPFDFGRLPLAFEANEGQFPSDILYLARAQSSFVFFTSSGLTMDLATEDRSEVIEMRFSGANSNPEVGGTRSLPGRVNYFIGSNPANWKTKIPTFALLRYSEIYPGIHAEFRGEERGLEFDFIVTPGADPRQIRMTFDGNLTSKLSPEGHLMLGLTEGHELAFLKPFTYQQINGTRVEVESRYQINPDGTVSIALGTYNRELEMVIDPIITFSTFLGGSQSDGGVAIAVDAAGNSFVTGNTRSPNFPASGDAIGVQGAEDLFVVKLDPTGQNMLFSTIIGGWRDDRVFDIKINRHKELVICGETGSFDFPVIPGNVQTTKGGGKDAFVAGLSPTGDALSFSTYLGGFSDDSARGVDVNNSGMVITGITHSVDFPTTTDAMPGGKGAPPDAFLTKLTLSAREWVYSGYLGGSGIDEGLDVALDGQGAAYIAGRTLSANLPVVSPFQKDPGGSSDGMVAKVSADGRTIEYVSYLGGKGADSANRLATDQQGNVIIVGTTASGDFPLQLPLQAQLAGGTDAFVTILGLKGAGAVFSTFLGGKGNDAGLGLALDSSRNICFTGETDSADFPVLGAFQNALGGGKDAFVGKLSVQGGNLLFASYLGGSDNESGHDVVALDTRNLLVVGQTRSGNFPVSDGFDSSYNGNGDAFVTKISETSDLYFAQFGDGGDAGASIRSTVRILNLNDQLPSNVRIAINNQDGSPMSVDLNGEIFTGQAQFVIPPSGLLSLATDGEGELQVGSVRVTSNTPVSGVTLFRGSIGVTGVGSAERLRQFAAPAEVGEGINTGVAVMNLGPQQRIRIVLNNLEGDTVAEAREDLEAASQFAKFITELNWDTPPDLSSFLGSLVVIGNADLAGTVLVLTPEGLTTQPVERKP